VFKDSEDFTVRCKSEEIGTITTPPPVGDRFALAGRVWEVTEVDIQRRLIFVIAVEGKMEISWPGGSGEIHTKLVVAMRDILFNGKQYAFLGENARERLDNARMVAKNAGMDKDMLIFLGGGSYVLFPWLGTRSFRTLRRFLQKNASVLGISDIHSEGCCYIKFKSKDLVKEDFLGKISSILMEEGLDTHTLVSDGECPVFDKYDEFIPPALLRAAYAEDRLMADEVLERFL
jgi:ATP-dependent Lhr-like helicase